MECTRLAIPDVILCEPQVFGDDRGYFTETFRQDKLEDFLGYKIKFCQDNEAKSSYGVLRGLHYQLAPHAQTKLVRVITGSVLDVAVDIRKGFPSFGKHVVAELTGENKKQLLVPRGFAHGFFVLSEEATFAYKVDNYYSPECDRGITFKENWPDVRNTKEVDVISALKAYNTNITIYHPWANVEEVLQEYNLVSVKELPKEKFDGIVLTVSHNEFKELDYSSLKKENSLVYNVKNILSDKVKDKNL
jgi:dTDP-4-dehydrorhamnose 3,5-epimerase